YPGRSRMWCAWWFPNCNGAVCSAPNTSRPPCGDTLGCNDLRTAGPVSMLDGLRVLDLATLAAAPLVATYLGEFGADVIKVEEPRHGDPIRGWGNQRDGVGLMWKSISRNKRSVTLNLRCPEGQELVRRLAVHADVAIFNTRPQTLRKWGLDYDS